MNKLLSVLLALLVFSAPVAASTPVSGAVMEDARYDFFNLEEVDSFTNWNIRSWQAVDSRSLIIDVSPSRSYLLVLNRKLPELRFSENISISSSNSQVTRFDRVQVLGRHSPPVGIEKIYFLPDREARDLARARILAPGI